MQSNACTLVAMIKSVVFSKHEENRFKWGQNPWNVSVKEYVFSLFALDTF